MLTGLGRKSTEIMAAICKGFSLFHCLSLLAEAALIAEQGFSSRGLTSRAACSWSLIPWFVTLEQQGQGRRGNTYPTVVVVRMAEWPEGSRPRSCSQLYFVLDVSCGHLTNLSLDLSLSHNGNDQVLWDMWKTENAKTFCSISLLNIGLDKHLWILLLFR